MEIPRDPQTQRIRRTVDKERRRAARACDGCRRQKEKCDGGVPCRRCFRLGRKCEFSGRIAKGGPPSPTAAVEAGPGAVAVAGPASGPSPDQAPEAFLGHSPASLVAQCNVDLTQHVLNLERIVRHYAGDINFDAETVRNLAENAEKQNRPPRPAVTQTGHHSSNGSELVGVDDENFDIKPLENNITHYSGEFSHWNFSMRIKQWIDQRVPGDDFDQSPQSTTDFKEYYRAEELQSPSNVVTSLASLPPRGIASFLVHCFFKHSEANYFYIERQWLEERLDAVYERAASLNRRDIGAVCVIFMVLAIGTQYAYLESYSEHIDGVPYGQDRNNPNVAGLFSEDTVGVMFYQQACRLLPDVITVSSLESVQACLLIGMYTLPLDASGLSYIYLNLAVKLAIQNGMHRKYPGDGLDATVRETRNRVWWTAYTIEKRVGIFHGRPISIAAADVDADLPVDRTDIWPSTTGVHAAHFLATLHLNQVLGQMSHEISILKKFPKQDIANGLGRLVELHRGLVAWWDALPDNTFCKDPTVQSSTTRMGIHLKLEYCLIRIFVGRAFIFPRDRSATRTSSAEPKAVITTPPSSSSRQNSSRTHLVADCISASLDVIHTCRTLRSTIGLARASYTEFSACRAALLVIITQCLQKQTDQFRRALRDGLSMLKEMSAGESARSEMSLIEAFERAVARLDAVAGEKKAESEYEQFKKWEQMMKTGSGPSMESAGEDIQPAMAMPLAPQPANAWRPEEGAAARQGTVPVPSHTPFFGIDGNFASFPQTLDEFSSFLGYSFGHSPDYSVQQQMDEGTWMGPGG